MRDIIQQIKENYKLLLGVLITGMILGWLIFHSGDDAPPVPVATEDHEGHDHESEDPAVWTCSMHPQVRQDEPGDCPICGMDLIPLSTMDSGDDIDPNEIMMTESAAKLADIQTTTVSRGNPQKTLFLQGKVEADERNMAELTARFGGRIERLFVNFTGENVGKNEKLATVYSPELVTAQRELIEAIALKESRPALYNAARAKLKLWDLTDEQIAGIEENAEPQVYFDVMSPIGGTVLKRHVAVGDYVKAGSPLFMLSDLSRVWVMFDAYESDLPWIQTGDRIEFTVQSLPGQTYEANVSFIDPFIHPQTRSAKVRVVLNNPGLKLKPEMFASGVLHSDIAARSDQLLIPKSSVLWTGKRSVVYVKVPERESPSFRYREIELGPEAGDFYVVADGLEEGEQIATHGVFKIDAAAQLEGKQSMMNPTGGRISTGHDHGSMEMEGTAGTDSHEGHTGKVQEQVPEEFREQLTEVYHDYIDMKNAFVESDPAAVSKGATEVSGELGEVDMGLLQGEIHMDWMEQLETLETTLETIRGSSDIEAQRRAFAEFNLAFYDAIKTFGLRGVTTYYQYCPMANRDKGAYWFSNVEEIRNPYFGDAMLGCGETRETIR